MTYANEVTTSGGLWDEVGAVVVEVQMVRNSGGKRGIGCVFDILKCIFKKLKVCLDRSLFG